jgi:hypothetical protein
VEIDSAVFRPFRPEVLLISCSAASKPNSDDTSCRYVSNRSRLLRLHCSETMYHRRRRMLCRSRKAAAAAAARRSLIAVTMCRVMSNALGLGICGRGGAPHSQNCACGAVSHFDSLCRRPLAVPRMPHTAPRLPFSARHACVASAAAANVLSVFPLSLPLQPHVLRHLLVRCLQKREKQAPAHSA